MFTEEEVKSSKEIGITPVELRAIREEREKMEGLPKKLLQIIFDELGPEGVSVDDVKEITQGMIGRMTATKMVLDS